MVDITRPITSTTSFARVAYFHYKKQNFCKSTNERPGDVANVFQAQQTVFGVIEDAIEAISINKGISGPSGTFDITLLPTQNWKQVVSPGDWIVIYLYRENVPFVLENKNIALIGNIERVNRTKQKDEESDKTLVRYHISGKDFGKVFEETDIFANPYSALTADPGLVSSLLYSYGYSLMGSPTELVVGAVDTFLSPTGADLSKISMAGASPSQPLGQWMMPVELVALLGGFGNSFYSVLNFGDTNFAGASQVPALPGYVTRVNIRPGEGVGLWGYLMESCNKLINELWTDMYRRPDGSAVPALFLRPRPCSVFFDDKSSIKCSSLIDLVNDGDFIELSSDEIYFSDLGRDDHGSANMVWLNAAMIDGLVAKEQFANVLTKPGQIGLPMYSKELIARSGLKRFKAEMKFVYAKANSQENVDIDFYKKFIAYLWDIKSYNLLYESGTIEAAGTLAARTGSVLRLPSEQPSFNGNDIIGVITPPQSSSNKAKLYYIEGYRHEWRFPDRWTTTFQVTQGQFEDESNPFIDLEESDQGAPDTDIDKTSLVKTNVPRNGNSLVAALGNLGATELGGILA